MESRRLFLAILLSIVVIVGWQYMMGPPPSSRGPAESGDSGSGQIGVGVEADSPSTGSEAPGASEGAESLRAAGSQASPGLEAGTEVDLEDAASPVLEPIEGAREERVVLESERVRVELSSRGAQVISFVLKQHASREGGPVDLVRARIADPYPFGVTARSGASHPLNQALFQVERLDDQGVRFRYRGAAGEATKTFRFQADASGKIRDLLEVEIDLPHEDGWNVLLGPGLRNPSQQERNETYFARRRGVYGQGETVETVDAAKAERAVPVSSLGLRWVGLDDNYFLAVVLFDPRGAGHGGAVFEPVLLRPSDDGADFQVAQDIELLPAEQKELERELRVRVEPGAEGFRGVAYWGAKRLEVLSDLALPGTGGQVAAQLDHTIELSFLRIIADPLLRGLHWIHESVVANYGWAIVLMTLLLKLLLLPLTHKSYVSMRKMQEIQPKMEALRAKYRPKLKDKQGRPNMEAQRKMNEEMMALFKAEGVNPAGGCLPMLLQMPFFFAFYFILREAVELRNATWLWVPDLSAPEPTAIHWLPLVMTVTQFLQQRMTPMAGDPMQRRLFQLLPFFFLVLFWGMPSGLVLYWLTNNVLTIGQQSIYNHLKKRGASPEGDESAKSRGKKARRAQAK